MRKKQLIISIFIAISMIINICWYLYLRYGDTYYGFAELYIDETKLSFFNIIIILNIILLLLIILKTFFEILKKISNNSIKNKILMLSYLLIIILTICLNISFTSICKYGTTCCIHGNSMDPTIKDNDTVYVKYGKEIKRFDIIIFEVNQETLFVDSMLDQYYIKRVIGLPGDKIEWVNKKLYINNIEINEPYIDASFKSTSIFTNDFMGNFKYKINGCEMQTQVIPDNYCFVMGDNRACDVYGNDESLDSRIIGLVPISNIVGIVNIDK